ncbi:hypothetical protein K1T71_002190 [Dendrolimus kikuchii]|uniref:Uncharacterized protein n=1 Tax=Dendrolimus kikuchii TaxID=765133 RepID=A0ACC1DHH0_9NEOP|nr:hypothetical protein K1T71_002190 [Dendrolimus kikuchii]
MSIKTEPTYEFEPQHTSTAVNCKYCTETEDKQIRPGLICERCGAFVHLVCLQRPGTPGDLVCDVFFDFICENCSPDKSEVFNRNKFPWVNVIYLTLYHLNNFSYGISNHGYFHYKTHICSFIDRYWQVLFGNHTKQKKNWVGTIAGVLSVYNKVFFISGSGVLRETGWWRLLHNFSPAVAAHIIQELSKDKLKTRKSNLTLDKTLFIGKIVAMGYKDLINDSPEASLADVEVPVPLKKKRVDSDELSAVSNTSFYDHLDSDSRTEIADELAYEDSMPMLMRDHSELEFKGFDYNPVGKVLPSDSSSVHSLQQSIMYYDSDSRSGCFEPLEKKPEIKPKRVLEEKPAVVRRENLFSFELNSVDMPWEEKLPESRKDLVELTQYEEVHLLKQVEGLIPKIRDPSRKASLCRLKAKLALRRLKRHKHLPIFDLDKTVKILGGYVTEDPRVVANVERVLDRFQRSYLIDNLCGTIASSNYGTLLLSSIEPTPFRSAYSGVMLKPFIRRDHDSKPMWLQLHDELLRRTNRHIKDYEPPRHVSIDYSYIRPQHIAAVNNLCAQFFWPGIDVTEALQYPEFSCVVTYKKVVIACAFLVPDAGLNTAYISFILTRPEWRNARIASFMLYHLLQTCTGKDVTLHVSPTNSAIFLYQKFGFKVEEMIQDFYEKYYDMDYKGCRHALFLRLIR